MSQVKYVKYREHVKFITVEEMNKKLSEGKKKYPVVTEKLYMEGKIMNDFDYMVVMDSKKEFKIRIKEDGKYKIYQTNKDGTENLHDITGAVAYATMQNYVKTKDFSDDKAVISFLGLNEETHNFGYGPAAILKYNPKFNKKRVYAYSYDVNSAFSWALVQPMPDTDGPYHSGVVGNDEIGFEISDSGGLQPVFSGKHSLFIFKKIESPYKRFVEVWYGRKKEAKNAKEKQKAKDVMNFSIGMLQHHNPFIRSMVIYYSNKKIMDYWDPETSIYCNTDSIVSSVKRSDIMLGAELGDFKIEHEGEFACINHNYQWDNNAPSMRGTPKSWFKEDFDFLKDKLPSEGNLYEFNMKTVQLEKVNGKK